MDKKTAQDLIEKTFNNAFSEEQFTVFTKNLLNDFEDKHNHYSGNLIWDDYKEHINSYKRIGKYIDPEGEALDVLIVEVKSVTKLERARTVLRNFVIKHLKKFEKTYALVAFYSKEDGGADWRFSFIKLDYSSFFDEEKKKVKIREEIVPAKRYSFLVGKYEKAHTAKNQLLPLLQNIANNPTIEELETAFSIEKVTDEFFNQYKDLYIKLYEHFENDSPIKAELDKAGIDNARFTKKLLGQIVFLYFLQKKGWLGVVQNERWGTGKKRFVQELYETAQAKEVNFFKDKLQYLFYEALAKERDNVNSYYKRFDCRIPFLNGGLFEADYDWQNADITIPSTLFRNEEKNKSGDMGTGVLDVFDRYNFTIKEDEPLDKEVAVDPEMLGKVFENMLDITERKSKGAFYTPREIVHYMCQESLIHYLDNCLNSSQSSSPDKGRCPQDGGAKSSPPLKEEYPKGEVVGKSISNLPHLKTFRKNLRNNLTPAEATLWKMLQGKQLDGRKFRRQHSVGNYILDFYCPSEKIAIELDGQGHFEATQAEYDYERDLFLQHCGIKVLRFENKWVWDNPDGLLEEVKSNFGWNHPGSSSHPSFQGGELLGVPKKDIETYIREGHFALENDERVATKGESKTYQYQLPESIRLNADLIDQKLSSIKICDPAIGSGAFPVGLLHELVNAMLVLKPHLSYDYRTEKLKGFGFEHRESVSDSRYIYRLKRHIIQESIYGVDIDASAIDIARLRLWLSLVVDEDDLDPIETLPNLDYKIVCGNSLIGLPENSFRDLNVEAELEKLKEKFYNITDEKEKKALRQQINTKIRELLDSAEQFAGYKIDFDFKLFFSEVWREKGGFDVVIGNPPYLRIQGIRENNPTFANLLVKLYESATGSFDLYVCFTEKGLSLTHSRGVLNFIMPIKWTNSAFGKGLRILTKRLKSPKKIISFSAYQVFNASTYTAIQLFQRNSITLKYTELSRDLPNKSELDTYINGLNDSNFNKIPVDDLKDGTWILTDSTIGRILKMLNRHETKVVDVFEKFFTGLQTSKDSVYFIMDGLEKGKFIEGYSKELNRTVSIEKGLVKPLLKGDQVHRYDKLKTLNYVIFPYHIEDEKAVLMEEIEIKNSFPLGFQYLKENESVLRHRENGKLKNDDFWYRYIYPKNLTLFKESKIITPYLSKPANLSVDLDGAFTMNTKCFGLIKKDSIKWDYLALLGVLNSEICWYFISSTGTVFRGGYFAFTPDYLNSLPIPNLDDSEFNLKVITSYIINSPKKSISRQFFDSLMNSIAYELYFPEEIKSAGKEILKHLGDLKPITDEMSEEKKLAIIQSEFERLYDPNHPVRFAIETLDSVEEVRIIKEALK